MDRIELLVPDSWLVRTPAAGPAAAAGGGGAAPAGSNPPGDAGAHYPVWLAENMAGSDHPVGDVTLLNPQPSCGMGPTLYDLAIVKRRQRERLRDCFRRFRRGQKLDARDPSGEWIGAVVRWAPPVCHRSKRGVPAPDCVEVSLSCPWISHCAGGGVVTYRLPRSTSLGVVLADVYHLAGISLWRARIQRASVHLAADIRKGRSEVKELDDRRTLEYHRIPSGSVLIVCVVPAKSDILPTCPPAVPPRPGQGGTDSSAGGGSSGGGGSGSSSDSSDSSQDGSDGRNFDVMVQDD